MRLIDADATFEDMKESLPVEGEKTTELVVMFGMGLAMSVLKAQPTIDAVPVVRCKDCVHLETLNGSTYYARCKFHGRLFESFGRADTRKWFCADGERKEK